MKKIVYLNIFLAIIMIIFGGYLVIAGYPELNILGILFLAAGAFTLIMDLVRNKIKT